MAETRLPHRPSHLAVSPHGETVVACSPEGAVTVLSADLRTVGSFDLRVKVDGMALGPGGGHLGLSMRDGIRVVTARGEVVAEVLHQPWPYCAGGGCSFSPDGRHFWAVRPSGTKRMVTVQIMGYDGWRAIASQEFEAEEDGDWMLIPHPEGEVMGLWLGAGQDGQWLRWCGIAGGIIHVDEQSSLSGTGPPSFHPAGGEFLTDDLNDELLRRHRFPGGEVIGQLSGNDIFSTDEPEGDRETFDGVLCHLSDHRVIISSSDYRLRLIELRAMQTEGEIELEGRPPRLHRFRGDPHDRLYGDVEQCILIPGNRLLTTHCDLLEPPANRVHVMGVWDASPLCGPMKGPDDARPHTRAYFSQRLR